MSQLSTSVVRWILDWLEGHSVSAEEWTGGICEIDALFDPDGSTSWETFVALSDRLRAFSDAPPEGAFAIPGLVEIGREIAEEVFAGGESPFPIAELPLELLYVESLPAFASHLDPDIEIEADVAADGEVVLWQISLPEPGSDCSAAFALIQGALEVIPTLAGHDDADVAIDLQPGRARVAIRIPDAFENVIPIDTNDLSVGLDEVAATAAGFSYADAFESHDADRPEDALSFDEEASVLDAPALEFEAPDRAAALPASPFAIEEEPGPAWTASAALHHAIATAPDLDATVDRFFDHLKQGLGCRAARLALQVGPEERRADPYRFGRLGSAPKPPEHAVPIQAAGRAVARLELWRKAAFEPNEIEELEVLLPGLGLALFAHASENDEKQEDSTVPRLALIDPLLEKDRTSPGDPLRALTRALGQGGRAHTAAIGLRSAERPMQLRARVCWRRDGESAPFEYDATGTPCAEVLAGQIVAVSRDAETSFPALLRCGFEKTGSYLGAPLRNAQGEVIGVLAMWRGEGVESDEGEQAQIRLLAERAEVELQRAELEKALSLQVSHSDALAETAQEILLEFDAQRGTPRVSPAVEALLGYSAQELVASEIADLVHPGDRASLEAAVRTALESHDSTDVALRLLDTNGIYRPFSIRMQIRQDEERGIQATASALDLSQVEGAERERDRLISIVENSSDLIALFSLQGAVISMNESGQRMLGLASEEEARSKTLYDFAHENTERPMKFEILPAVHRRHQWEGEFELRHLKTEQAVRVEARLFTVSDRVSRQPLAIAMIARDTTAIRQRDQVLLESEERYRMLADNPYELIAELDQAGHFIYTSENFEAALGRTPESLLGNFAVELIHEDDRERMLEHFRGISDHGGNAQFEVRVRHREGHYRWVEATLRTYRNAAGRTMTVVIARDITERVESTEALRQTQHKLQQSQKMEAIGRMAGGVAHDFNNLLTAITGYCDLLIEDLGETHPARVDAQEILKAAERAAGLTHQLLAFSRRQVLQPRVVDMNNLVADLDRMLRRLIGEAVELITVLDGTAWPTKADPGQLHQVLLNLVVNARDAMPNGGRITIETANQTVEQPIATDFDEIPAGDYIVLSVRDTGTGMSPEILSMIFEPFFTTKDSGKGTGLGLSTVIGIVQQTGGYIRVESTLGRGTTFFLYLTRTEGVAMLPEHNTTPVQFDGQETVMVVEDSDPVRNLVIRCLERHGYSVLAASSGAEALKLANRHDGPIDLFLCDVILPKMDGIELGRRVQEARPGARVIHMSGFTDDGLAKHGVDISDIALLEKPFTPSTLLRAVREYLDEGTLPVPPTRSLPEDDQIH